MSVGAIVPLFSSLLVAGERVEFGTGIVPRIPPVASGSRLIVIDGTSNSASEDGAGKTSFTGSNKEPMVFPTAPSASPTMTPTVGTITGMFVVVVVVVGIETEGSLVDNSCVGGSATVVFYMTR